MVQVSWSFYISDVDPVATTSIILILHGYYVVDVRTPFLVFLYHFLLVSRESLVFVPFTLCSKCIKMKYD